MARIVRVTRPDLDEVPIIPSVGYPGVPTEELRAVVFGGFPGPSPLLRHEIAHLGNHLGELGAASIVVVPDTPLANFYTRQWEDSLDLEDNAPTLRTRLENRLVFAARLSAAIRQGPMGQEGLSQFFGAACWAAVQ